MNDKIIVSIHGSIDNEDQILLSEISIELIERTQLTGGNIITEAIILATSPFIIKGIKDVLLSLINKDRNVSLKCGEFEAHNIKQNQTIEVMSELKRLHNNSIDNKLD